MLYLKQSSRKSYKHYKILLRELMVRTLNKFFLTLSAVAVLSFGVQPRVRQIVADAGWSGSADQLIAKVAAGDFTEQAYPIGTRLQWMGAKKDGQYVALPNREWAGNESLPAFQVMVENDCQVHEIVIPKACCNVSLGQVTKSNSAECRPQPVAVAPAPEPEAAPVEKAVNILLRSSRYK